VVRLNWALRSRDYGNRPPAGRDLELDASWRPIAQVLVADHVLVERDGNYFVTDMPALLDLMKRHARWKDIAGNTSFETNKAVLLSSTDVRTSNSAAIYLALASYIENGQAVIESQDEVDHVLPFMSELFMRQGFQESVGLTHILPLSYVPKYYGNHHEYSPHLP
jgi:hypothetical protein